jgi:hypothetical protein
VASIDGNPHATPPEKLHAQKVEKEHGIVIERLRNETTDNEAESARYFSGEGGDFIHLEQDKIGVQNTYMPWLGHNRSKTNSGYTDKLQMQLMMHCVAGTCAHCIHNYHIDIDTNRIALVPHATGWIDTSRVVLDQCVYSFKTLDRIV